MDRPSDSSFTTETSAGEFKFTPTAIGTGVTNKGCFVCGKEFMYDTLLHRFVGQAPAPDTATRIRKQCFLPNRFGVEALERPDTERLVAIHACTDHFPNLAILFKLVEQAGNIISAGLVDKARNAVITLPES